MNHFQRIEFSKFERMKKHYSVSWWLKGRFTMSSLMLKSLFLSQSKMRMTPELSRHANGVLTSRCSQFVAYNRVVTSHSIDMTEFFTTCKSDIPTAHD